MRGFRFVFSFICNFQNTGQKAVFVGNSIEVQGLRLCSITAWGPGSIPGQETKILEAMWHYQKKIVFKHLTCCLTKLLSLLY